MNTTIQYANRASRWDGDLVCGIYVVESAINGKIYVGQAVDIEARWRDHRRELRGGTHGNRHLQNAWSRHGEQAFTFRVALRLHDEFMTSDEVAEALTALEQRLLDREVARRGRRKVYNAHVLCVRSGLGHQHTDEAKAKIRAYYDDGVRETWATRQSARWGNPDYRTKMSEVSSRTVTSQSFLEKTTRASWPEGAVGILWEHETLGRMISNNPTRTCPLLGISRSAISQLLNGRGRAKRAKGWRVRYVMAGEDLAGVPVLPLIPGPDDLPW